MAPTTPQPADDSHQILLDQMDISAKRDRLGKPGWKTSSRRNKNTKQIISESQRKEASTLVSQNNSGATTPFLATTGNTDGALTPAQSNGAARPPNIAQAAQSLSTLVLEKNLRSTMPGPTITYTNIDSAPSLHPGHKHYCDITGLPAKYTDPKTRLRYHDREVFAVVRTLAQNSIDEYLSARGAYFILK